MISDTETNLYSFTGAGATYDVIFKGNYAYCALSAEGGCTVNMTLEDEYIQVSSHRPCPLFSGPGTFNVILNNTDAYFFARDGFSFRSAATSVNVSTVSGGPYSGEWYLRYDPFRRFANFSDLISSHIHFASSYTSSQYNHSGDCVICGKHFDESHDNVTYINDAAHNVVTCMMCEFVSDQGEPHTFTKIDDQTHGGSCTECSYESATPLPHDLVEYSNDERAGSRCAHCDYDVSEEHVYGEAVFEVVGFEPMMTKTCEKCGHVYREVAPRTGDLVVNLTDSYGDGWNGAALVVCFDGVEVGELTIVEGSSAQYYVAKTDGQVITIRWKGGAYDSECEAVIAEYGTDNVKVDSLKSLSLESGLLIYSANLGNYDELQAVVDSFNANSSSYDPAQASEVRDYIVGTLNWNLSNKDQAVIDGYVSTLRTMIEALASAELSEGYFDLTHATDTIYITAEGYRWGYYGTVVPYTGPYKFFGTFPSTKCAVDIESGSHDIELCGLFADSLYSPICLADGVSVSMTLTGINKLSSGNNGTSVYAGIYVPGGSSLIIDGSGSLDVTGTGVGIGGGFEEATAGSITINGTR